MEVLLVCQCHDEQWHSLTSLGVANVAFFAHYRLSHQLSSSFHYLDSTLCLIICQMDDTSISSSFSDSMK
jgi:hypothetical protein